MQRLKLGLVCLSWLIMASALSAQTSGDPTVNSGSGVATLQNFSGGGVLNGTYFNIRQMIGDGVGWQNSYSQLGLFTPFWIGEDSLIAPNAQLIITNSTQTGVNAGLVGRTYVDSIDRLFGVYGFYDNDQDAYNNRFSQFNVGAETLGTWWDLRANGYFVTGLNNAFLSAQGLQGGPFYVGNNIAFTGLQNRDQALSGVDSEFGVPVSPYTQWLRAYAGAYGYNTGNSNTIGFRGRIEANVSNDLTLGVMVTQDALFGTNINGMIDFKFSGFLPTRYFPNWTTRQRMLNPVQRNWRIATHTYTQAVDVDAINPATNQPYFITHVNNTAAAGGNGTIEHPYQHLQSSPQADIILVHLGNANSLATAVTGSAVLSNNQRLLGDGIISTVNLFAHYGASTINGNFVLPGTNNSGNYPYVTNPGGDIVTLANNNEVAGLNFIGSGGTAITNTAAGSNNFNLHHLEIAQNAGYGVKLVNASGSGILSSINVGTTDHANPLGIGNNTLGGVQISTGAPGLNLQLSNVYMNSVPTGTQGLGISLDAANGYLNANLNNVFANGNAGPGILLSETSQNLTALLNSIQANNNGGVGVGITGTGGSINVTGNDVAAIGNKSDNLQIGTQAAPVTNAVVNVNMINSSFSKSKTGSGVVFSGSNTFGSLNLISSVYGNKLDGLDIFATNGSLITANVKSSNFVNNGRDAFHVVSDTGATTNLSVGSTNATGSGRDGLFYHVGQNATFNTAFMNSKLDNSGTSAVFGTMTNFATLNLFFNHTTGANSGADGFYLNATNNSTANINIQDGTFQNSGVTVAGSSAVEINSDNSTVAILTDNTLTNQPPNFSFGGNVSSAGAIGNQWYGLTLNIQDSSVFSGTFENGDFSNALVNAIDANILSNSNAFLTLYRTNGNKSGSDGFFANVDNSQFTTNLTFSNLNSSGANGANFNVVNGGNMTANFNYSTINNSGTNGILATVSGATSVATINLLNSANINSSGNSGVNFDVSGGTLNVNGTSDSISNSGAGGVSGSGVLGLVTNSGTANLGFLNMTINNNLDNGVFVTTNTGGNINATFDLGSVSNNGVNSPNAAANNNDGIRLVMDDSTSSSLNIVNGVKVNGNGNNGVTIIATDGTQLTGLFDSSSIANNGVSTTLVSQGAGVDITVDGQNATPLSSNVSLFMSGMAIDNTAAGGPQQYGLLTSTSNFGQLFINMNSSDLSHNAINAINSAATTASITSLNFADVTADSSGSTGALLNVTSGAILNFTDYSSGSANTTSISSSGGSGILVTVDGAGSFANFNIDGLNLNSNGATFGGQGFIGIATNGANLNAFIANSNIQGTSNQGIEINSANANTVARFNVFNVQDTNNGSEGLLINVTNQGTAYYRSIDSTYSNNGTNGGLDGVQINATGTGALNSATAISLFSGDTVDNNAGNGFSLNSSLGATLTTSIQNVDISNNGKYGIFISADNTVNTQFNLLMSGTNTLNGNALGSFNNLNFSGINQVVLQLTGTFSNPTGDGVHVSLTNILNGEVAIQGPGTIDNSGGNGIYVSMNNVTNGSLLVSGFSEINNSTLDGIDVIFNTVNAGAIQIQGPTNINNSGNDAVDISLTNTNLVNGLAYSGSTIQILTLTNNLATVTGNAALDNALPDPVTVNLSGLGITPANALTVDSISASGSGKTGINIVGTSSNIAANGSFITNNVILNSIAGDGIHLNFNTVTADGLAITGNGSQGNANNGINVELFNSPINGLNISNNNGGTALVGGTLNFTYSNIIWTTFMNNNSTAGIDIAKVSIDLTNATQPQVWRPDQTPGTAAFEPVAPTDVTVGLDSVNGVAITPGHYPVQDTSGNVLPYGGIPINSELMTLGFNNFTPGDQLHYVLAHGQNSSAGNTLYDGTQEAGATGTVTLADGRTFTGVFTNTGLQITQALQATANGISSNGLDGIRLNLNNSNLTNLNVSNNVVSNNGTTGVGNGVEFTGASGAVVNSNITNAAFASNTITGNNGDGIKLVNPTSASNLISATFDNNTISTNTGTGVNLNLSNGGQSLTTTFSKNTISSNTGGPGINVQLADHANFTSGFGGNTINSNGAQGINIQTGTGGIVAANFTGNTINGNTSDGIKIALGNAGQFNSTAFYGNTIGTKALPNGGLGVELTVPSAASFNWNLGDVSQAANLITGNVGAGVGITMTGTSTGTLVIENTTFSNTTKGTNPNFNGEGLNVTQQGQSLLNGVIVASTFTNNAGDGALFQVTGNNVGLFAQLQSLNVGDYGTSVLGNTFNNNGANGLEFFRTADGEIGSVSPIAIGYSTFDSNTQNGLVIRAANKLHTDNYTINNNDISKNTQNGVLFDERADAQISANMTQNTIETNKLNGIKLIEQINAASDHRALSGVWTLNTITGNGTAGNTVDGNGIWLNGGVVNLTIGDASNSALGNTISNNVLNGVEDTGYAGGANGLIIGSNTIQSNGTLANLNTATENAGVLLNVFTTSTITVENNNISNNFGDGVQYQINSAIAGNFATAKISINNGNTITNNHGRGVNLINRGNNTTKADISGNFISANELEGVYIVNTASTDQTIWASSTTPLLADGGFQNIPNLQLRMVGNQIIGNGLNSSLSTTGLVIRVGSAEAFNTPSGTADGGFAQTTPASIARGASAATFFGLISSSNAGVIAQIDNNVLGGNFGNDISFSSFTSTVAPPTSAGAWNNNFTSNPVVFNFAPTSIWSDPLSRFDLYFRGNTTDAGAFDSLGNGLGGYAAVNPALVAFYNNSEATFKSATAINTTNPQVNGPFQSATRNRNATREGATMAVITAATGYTSPTGNAFLFPGLGPSTWRVSTDSLNANGAANVNAVFTQGVNVNNVSAPYGAGVYLNGSVVPDETSYIFGEF